MASWIWDETCWAMPKLSMEWRLVLGAMTVNVRLMVEGGL